MKLIVLIYPSLTDQKELIAEIRSRAWAFADIVVVGTHTSYKANWDQMELEAKPRRGDYVFVMEDTDYIDDISSIRRWLAINNESAYACMRLNMYTDNLYRMDGPYKPRLLYQLFPYVPKSTLHEDGLPTYSYALPYINDPHLTILSFRDYGYHEKNSVTTKEWENPIPKTAA